MNKYVENEVVEANTFVTPTKSEFEKQADYEVRLKKAKLDFYTSEPAGDPNSYRFKMVNKYFNPMVGAPQVSRYGDSFKYDADNEVLTLKIKNDYSEQTSIPAVFKNVSPEIAKAFRTLAGETTGGRQCVVPHVALEWSRYARLTAKYLVFDYYAGCAKASDMSEAYKTVAGLPETHPLKSGVEMNHQLPVEFSKDTADNYEKILAGAEQNEKSNQAELNKTKIWYPLYSKIKDEIYECFALKNNIAGTAMLNGDKAAYDILLGYRTRYAICFR